MQFLEREKLQKTVVLVLVIKVVVRREGGRWYGNGKADLVLLENKTKFNVLQMEYVRAEKT